MYIIAARSYVRPKAVCEYYRDKFGVDMSGNIGWAQVRCNII